MTVMTMKMATPKRLTVGEYEVTLGFSIPTATNSTGMTEATA
jgi:hypothetical protein